LVFYPRPRKAAQNNFIYKEQLSLLPPKPPVRHLNLSVTDISMIFQPHHSEPLQIVKIIRAHFLKIVLVRAPLGTSNCSGRMDVFIRYLSHPSLVYRQETTLNRILRHTGDFYDNGKLSEVWAPCYGDHATYSDISTNCQWNCLC
jgi:hypothetical protein